MLIKEVIEKVNEVLKNDFEKPVIKLSRYNGGYDEVNGRKVNDTMNVKNIIHSIIKNEGISQIYFNTEGRNITAEGTCRLFTLKTKSKKSDVIGWNYNNQLTIVSIELAEDYKDLEDKDLQQLIQEKAVEEQQRKEREKQMLDNRMSNFKNLLSEKGIGVEDFQELLMSYNSLDFRQQFSLKEN